MIRRNAAWNLSLAAAALGGALVVPSPVLGEGVDEPAPPPVSVAPPPVVRAHEPGPCVGDEMLGQVVAVSGQVEALAPGGAPRALGCDAPLRCEKLVTAPGASLSFVSGEVLVRVGGDSRVSLSGSAGAAELLVERGAVRATDARVGSAAPSRLVARDLAASAAGADLELWTRESGRSRLCAYDGSAAVDAGPNARTLAAGRCLESRDDGLRELTAAEPFVGLEAPGFCSFEVALDEYLSPVDVAAPALFAFAGGRPANDVPRDACDDPGSGCNAGRDFRFEDPDPVPGCDVPGVECGGGQD